MRRCLVRTTLTLDADVEQKLLELQKTDPRSFKEIVNHALRIGLSLSEKPKSRKQKFKVVAPSLGFVSGVDLFRLNQIADELYDADSGRTK